MGFLDSFERSLERAVGGAFAKSFRSGVHPMEIVAGVKREMDARATIVTPERMLVPREYLVGLSPEDYERLVSLGAELIDEITQELETHRSRQGYRASGSLRIALEEDHSLAEGMISCSALLPTDGVVWIPVLTWEGRRYPITGRKTVIGRGSDAHVVIDARGVSRQHCEILWDGKRAEITDLGSTNGTTLDGVRISRHPLPDRGVIGVGEARIVVEVMPQSTSDYQTLVESQHTAPSEDAP